MSTFAVFGMTRDFALAEARKKTPTTRIELVKGVRVTVDLTPDEWEAAVQKRADKVMAGARTVQLCKPFDAPQFARDFIALCRNRGGCRDLTIKARAPEKDGHGQVRKTKKGAPMLSWQPYKYDAA